MNRLPRIRGGSPGLRAPGAAGVALPDQLSHTLDPAVVASYDLVGFDLRFVERSTPISCGHAAEEPGGFWVRAAGYQPFARTAAEAHGLAEACARTAGWALPFATTANAARDMDIIRAALGEPRISYLAGSYGAMLGVAYSRLFPSRIDRLVLDSPPNYDTVWRAHELDRTAQMQANYDAFVAWLAGNDATYGLGATRHAVGAALTALLSRANTTPIVVGDHAWTFGELGYLLVLASFFDQLWPVVAIDVTAIRAGVVPPIPVWRQRLARALASYRRDIAVLSQRFPVYGPANAKIGPCAFWPVSRDNTVGQPAHPARRALITAALKDAAVPLANSVATRDSIPDSRLVTVDRRVHVPLLSGQGDECMNTAVTSYLVTGHLPDADLSC